MLSIGVMAGGQGAYYIGLAREDYYLDGGEPPGRWHGRGAEALGLSGTVAGDELTRLFEGYHPRTDQALVELQNGKGHRPGWDLTFSAPKSVSVLWSQADPETRRRIEEAHFQAVKAGLDYLESTCEVARRGKGGQEHALGKLVFATFEHGTSRSQDPQLHTHCLAMNVCVRQDGTLGTLDADAMFKAKMAAGALYRAELSFQLEKRLGLEVRRQEIYFEVAGVSPKLCETFSTRRAEIEDALREKGMDTAQAAAVAALSTRSAKEGHASREALFQEWGRVGQALGWGRSEATSLVGRMDRIDHAGGLSEALRSATGRVTQQQSYFTEREFTRRLAEECPGRGVGAEAALRAVRDHLSGNEEIVPLGRLKGTDVYTTREMMALEEKLLAAVDRSRDRPGASVPDLTLEGVIGTRKKFSDEQATALRHIAGHGGGVRAVIGVAGGGKTTLLHAARLAWEIEGYEVRGAALAGKAADGLRAGSGIESATIHRTLLDLRAGKLQLHRKSVLVVDEAGMVGTRLMEELVGAAERAGATLVLVGDARQLQPIEAGGPFPEIARRVEAATITEIYRQDELWARAAVHDFAAGRARKGLLAYAERGQLHITERPEDARRDLIDHWRQGGIRDPQDHVILTGTRSDATLLNRLAQDERRKAGQLSEASVPFGSERFHVGDRLLFTCNSSIHCVRNGSLGEVTDVDAEHRRLSVRLDAGVPVRFSLDDYEHVKLGYALTTHKGQGATVEHAYILAGGTMQDREISYVQVSRARLDTQIFADREMAGEGTYRLVKQMSESRAKEMAHAVQERLRQERHLEPSLDVGI